ncbi:unnamed protein product [Cunninghamella echinulata]
MSGNNQRNEKELVEYFPKANFITNDILPFNEFGEIYYRDKYVKILEDFLENGNTMLIMILENDVIPVYTKRTFYYHFAFQTLSLFSNDLQNFDCSKRGYIFKTGSSGNKSLCRIFSKENLREQIDCIKSLNEPIDIMIHYCQVKLNIEQRKF